MSANTADEVVTHGWLVQGMLALAKEVVLLDHFGEVRAKGTEDNHNITARIDQCIDGMKEGRKQVHPSCFQGRDAASAALFLLLLAQRLTERETVVQKESNATRKAGENMGKTPSNAPWLAALAAGTAGTALPARHRQRRRGARHAAPS